MLAQGRDAAQVDPGQRLAVVKGLASKLRDGIGQGDGRHILKIGEQIISEPGDAIAHHNSLDPIAGGVPGGFASGGVVIGGAGAREGQDAAVEGPGDAVAAGAGGGGEGGSGEQGEDHAQGDDT